MRLPKWFISISVLATIGVAVGWLWIGDESVSGTPPAPPESEAAPAAAPVQDQIPPPSVPDLLQARAPHPVREPPPTAAQIANPAPTVYPPQISAPSTAAEGVHSETQAPDLGSSPKQAQPSPTETQVPTTALIHRKRALQTGAPARDPPQPPHSLQTLVDERRDQFRRQNDARLDAYRGPGQQMPPWFAPYDDAVERYRDARRSQHRRQRDFRRQRHASWMDAVCPWSKPRREWSARRSYQRQMEQLNRRAYRDAYGYRPSYGFARPGGWR